MTWQSTSIIDKFSEHQVISCSPSSNTQGRYPTSALHRFDRISNNIDYDLLDLKTIREDHEDRALEIIINRDQAAVHILPDKANRILD